jgi:glutamine amidotransferase
LGWVHGVTRQLKFEDDWQEKRKLPHVGWSPITPRPCALFEQTRPGDYFYFVHSFTLECAESSNVAATAHYGETFTAAVLRNNVFGTQFHPEKSGKAGLRVLEAFCRWKP